MSSFSRPIHLTFFFFMLKRKQMKKDAKLSYKLAMEVKFCPDCRDELPDEFLHTNEGSPLNCNSPRICFASINLGGQNSLWMIWYDLIEFNMEEIQPHHGPLSRDLRPWIYELFGIMIPKFSEYLLVFVK